MLTVQTREWFDQLRRTPAEQSKELPEDQRLIRQFLLRGEALKAPSPTGVARIGSSSRELLGETVVTTAVPSVQPTRS